MTSYDNVYQKYNSLNSALKIEIKRVNSEGVYEDEWLDVDDIVAGGAVTHDSIPSMSFELANDSYSFGILKSPDCTIKLKSINGEFDSEDNSASIFNGYIRHKTLVKISHGYKYLLTNQYYYIECYRGFINEESSNTQVSNDNTYQNFFVEDLLTYLLTNYTFSEYELTSTTLEDFVYELFNRSDFTNFLTVDADNITAGYNVQNIDTSEVEGQTQWKTILQDLSIGHSFFYQKEGVLYYQPITAQENVAKLFDVDKIIKFENFKSGIDEVYEKLYWEDSLAEYEAPTILYNRSKTFDIETITNTTDQTDILSIIGSRTSTVRKKFKIKVLLYVNISVLQRIRARAGDYVEDTGLIWDIGNWDEQYWAYSLGASFSDANSFWMVKKINHNFSSGVTELFVEEV